jgi:nitroreductase
MDKAMTNNSVTAAICGRKTLKVMSDLPLPIRDIRETVEQLVDTAGWAPFHRPCDPVHQRLSAEGPSLDGIEPWRMYVLDAAGCRRLRDRLPLENAGKLPAMLAAADALIQVTWLPNPSSPGSGGVAGVDGCNKDSHSGVAESLFEPTLENMEHIAAASAAIQNLLVAATARGIPNYWSSGGPLLRSPDIFDWLGIPRSEILLGSIFLFDPSFANVDEGVPTSGLTVVSSKLRNRRTTRDKWMRWVPD